MRPDTGKDTVDIEVEIPVAVFDLDPLALIEKYREEWDALTEGKLSARGYSAYERFPVFVSDVIAHCLSLSMGLEGCARMVEDGWYEPEFTWTPESAERLDFLLDESSTAAMERAPNVVPLFDRH